MKKSLFVLGLLLTTSVIADELAKAEPEYIAELKEYCNELAVEDAVENNKLAAFLLKCVNEELESEGYQLLTKLK